MPPFLAMITPLSSGGERPDNTLPGWQPTPRPPGPVDPGYSPPWAQAPVDPGYGVDAGLRPTHPIYNPAYPDNTLPRPPGIPTHPIYNPPYPSQGPGFPTHPIVLPPPPGSNLPPIAAQLPVFPPEATHPIVLPPEVAPPETSDGRPIEWKAVWSPLTGWVVIGVPQGPVPTPSKR